MIGSGSKCVRLITPASAGTFQGQDGKVYPMAADRSIEVPEEFVSALLARGYTIGGRPDAAPIEDPESRSPGSAIATLKAPPGASGVSAGGRTYDVGPDGTVDVQVQDVAQLLDAGCSYYSRPRGI